MAMKKYVLAVLLTLCCAGLFFFLKSDRGKIVQAADVLPADVMVYAEQHDFVQMYKKFSTSRLGRILSRIDYVDIAIELGGEKEIVADALNLWQEIDKFINEPGFDQLLGKEFSLALFPMPGFSIEDPVKIIEERLLLIARPRHNAKVLQILASYITKDIEQSTVQYGSHTITRYKIDEQYTLATATVAGLVLAAVDERLVRKSLSIFDDQTNTLAQTSTFQQLRKSFEGAALFKYFSLEPLREQAKVVAEKFSEDDQKQVFEVLEQWNGWEAGAYGAWEENGLIREKLEIIYDAAQLDPKVAKLFATEPEKNNTLNMVPADSLFYYWSNGLNLPLLFDMYSELLVEQQPEMFDLLQQELRDVVGLEFEEILTLVANECAVIIEEVEEEGVPLPKVLMMVKLQDVDTFMQVFHKLLDEADIPISTSSYHDHEISYWGIAPQDGLQPAFTLNGDYLLLSNSRNLVKQLIDLQKNPVNTLINNQKIKELKNELVKENNSTAYVHIAHMADAFKTLATWAGGMAVLQGPETARKANLLIDEVVLPLLDGIAMYTQLASRTEVKESSIVMESSILVID